MRKTRGAALLTATALAVTGLAACGDEGGPAESSTTASPSAASESSTEATGSESSSSSSSSPDSPDSSSDLPVEMPEAAREQTEKGAAAFGKYYYEQFGEANRTGNTETIEMLDSQECLVCGDGVEEIRADAKKGWVRSKNPYSFSQVQATKRPDEGYKVAMQVKVAPHERVDSSGDTNAQIEATNYTLTLHVIWESDRWQIANWVIT